MPAELTVYSTSWCEYCRRLKGQLSREGISFIDIDVDREPSAAEYVMSVNGGSRTVPVVVFPDGSSLTNPSIAQVKDRVDD